MARKARVHFPGALYHVMLRGNGGQEIFLSQEDRFGSTYWCKRASSAMDTKSMLSV